jgi:hypothetical protein
MYRIIYATFSETNSRISMNIILKHKENYLFQTLLFVYSPLFQSTVNFEYYI